MSVEIDESKIISQGNEIFRMFGCIVRNTKQAKIRCVSKDRSKNKLLPIIKKYVSINDDDMDNNDKIFDENCNIKTRVFSDCFRSYQPDDFKNMGFILKQVNHSVWLGAGILNTNPIESLLHSLKSITKNCSVLTIEAIKKINSNEH